jgi:hypothetical protein
MVKQGEVNHWHFGGWNCCRHSCSNAQNRFEVQRHKTVGDALCYYLC